MSSFKTPSPGKKRRSPSKPVAERAGSPRGGSSFKEYTDLTGRKFLYDPKSNVARLSEEYKQWPKTLGPVELSTQNPSSSSEDRSGVFHKRLSAKYRQLDDHGCIASHQYLPGLLPGTVDRQHSKETALVLRKEVAQSIQAHTRAKGEIKLVALQVLDALEYFLPVVEDFDYQNGASSHKWTIGPDGTNYLGVFLDLLADLCDASTAQLALDETLVEIEAPVYVLGDLHGNYKDLAFFAAQFWRSGIDVCPANLLFLGDYVDRGPHSVELMSYLLALKVLYPNRVFLLRGNHELESVCGNVDYYGTGSFRYQLHELLCAVKRESLLDKTWLAFMRTFDYLPLAATIDKTVFCCHAGIPRAVMTGASGENILEKVRSIQRPLSEDGDIDGAEDCIAMDMLWADPASGRDQPLMGLHGLPPGFALNLDRGGDACVFGLEAVKKFLAETGCDYMLRAHQPPQTGVKYQTGARVITVFSSSRYCGLSNSAALIVISKKSMDIVTTGPDAVDAARPCSPSKFQMQNNVVPDNLLRVISEGNEISL